MEEEAATGGRQRGGVGMAWGRVGMIIWEWGRQTEWIWGLRRRVQWGWEEGELAQLGSKTRWAKLCCIYVDQNVEPFGLPSFFGVSSGLVCSFPLVTTFIRDDIGKVHVYLIVCCASLEEGQKGL